MGALSPLMSEMGSLNVKMDNFLSVQQKQFANMANESVIELECKTSCINRRLTDPEKQKQAGGVTLGGQDLPETPGGARERKAVRLISMIELGKERYFTATKRSKLSRVHPRRNKKRLGVLIQKKVKMKFSGRVKARRLRGIAYQVHSKRKKKE